MRNVSLSKYLSKSIHFLTIFIYIFTFLGPNLAVASRTITYTETSNILEEDRTFVLHLRSPSLTEIEPEEEFIQELERPSFPIESTEVIMGQEEAQTLLTPYLQKPEVYDPTDEWSGYSIPLIGAPINDTFKLSLSKRIEKAWGDLASRLQGAFLPLIQKLGLEEKAVWDLQDYITAVSQCAAFLKEHNIDHEGFEEENAQLIKDHLSSSTLDPYASFVIIQQDKMAKAVLVMWKQLVQSMGNEFTEQATRSSLNDGTFLSFQILASFVDDYLEI
ncbi:MAG TPA: hypothetical protein DD412_01135 [Holosporales bacterium]|nr:hypothetical protein [Holosporales bacterium]